MRFVVSWLGEFVDLADLPDARSVSEALTAAGLAVESSEEIAPRIGARGFVLEVDVTSNRPDAMCHFGLARELAVALGRPLRVPETPELRAVLTGGDSGAIVLDDPEGCPRYVARIIRGVAIGPSPDWLRERLEALGARSINNVVDATNYVLWELGQPLHAFDLATIPGGEIRVRRAFAGERLTTLDGKERALDAEILVIADRERAIALAGIMGGLATEVTATTTDVMLESAHFDRRRTRIGVKRLGLHTDASHRFERGVDAELCDLASRRCAALIVEVAGGAVVEPATDASARRFERVRWTLDGAALERFAGTEIADAKIEAILSGLGFAPERAGRRLWRGTVPGWRAVDFDPRRTGEEAGREAYSQDLYEEVLRHVGYARIPATLPTLGGIDAGLNPEHERGGRARDLLSALGYAEAIHYAFQPVEWDQRFPAIERHGVPLALANPLSERYALLRRSLVPNLVAAAEANANRGATAVRLFEVGHLFPGGEAQEIEALAWVAGGVSGGPWDGHSETDLFALKGVGEALAEELDAGALVADPAELPGVVPGTGALWRDAHGALVGWFGRLGAAETAFPLFGAELALDRLPAAGAKRPIVAPPRLPGISADLTLTHPLALTWAELRLAIDQAAIDQAAIESGGVELLVGFRLKERYQGAGVPAGAVATTITFDYHGGERTLTQDEINRRHAALQAELERRFGVERARSTEQKREETQ